jgi:hypothetical protein
VRALAGVDPELAATIVTAYWPGGEREHEEALLARADVVSVSGGDEAIAALARRVRGPLLAYGPRVSVVALGGDALGDARALAPVVALQVALHDQRGCLSPHAVYVEMRDATAARAFAETLAAALGETAESLPPGRADLEERAADRIARAAAEWEPHTWVFESAGGTVLYEEAHAELRPTHGRRTVRVHPLPSLAELPAALPADGVECVGLAGGDPVRLAASLDARGVSRLCPLDRMQRPPLAWPRGRFAPLGALLGRRGRVPLYVEV